DFVQPMARLHIISLLDRSKYSVKHYHEMWDGPYPVMTITTSVTKAVCSYCLIQKCSHVPECCLIRNAPERGHFVNQLSVGTGDCRPGATHSLRSLIREPRVPAVVAQDRKS